MVRDAASDTSDTLHEVERGGAEPTRDTTQTTTTTTTDSSPSAKQEPGANHAHSAHNVGTDVPATGANGRDNVSPNGDTAVAHGDGHGTGNDGVTAQPPPKTGTDAPEAGRTKLETTLIMAALCSALFLAALDVTIVATAVPTIVQEFASPVGYTWVGSAYLLANAALVPSWGKLSDIFGRKALLLCAVATFWLGSLICALANSMGMLIAARAIQGAGGGGIVVLVNICISDLFSMRTRGIYYGVLGMVWAIASAIGPVLGGVFTSKVTWRWCFYVNLPISAAGFAILVFVLKLHNPKTPLREGLAAIDWLGSLLIIGGTLMFLFGLEFGDVMYPWNSAAVICLLVFGVFTIGLFFVVETRAATYPVIPLSLFQNRANVAAFAVSFCHGYCFISGSYYLPLYFQAVLGADALLSGVYILPYALSLSFVSAGTGVWMKKTGQYLPPIIFGMAVMTLGFGLFIDLDTTYNWAKIVIFQIVAGIGTGPNFQSPLIALQSSVEPRNIASATSAFGFVRQLATSISVVIGGVVFQNQMQKQRPQLLAALGPELADQLSGGSAGGNVGVVAALRGEPGAVAKGAYWNSLRTMYIMYTCFAALGLLLSPLIGQKKLSKEHKEHKTGLKSLQPTDRDEEAAAANSAAKGEKETA
ncbi:major facilitator superfamily domain-containing protein [Apiospora aurea]|uniref:Major facilitator superfamily domain-containing protein n=1 Tax=Apiospora aurea TaxID=335848 RepID=A0ABR1QZ53_9PEZI